jgi:hypothetical protein
VRLGSGRDCVSGFGGNPRSAAARHGPRPNIILDRDDARQHNDELVRIVSNFWAFLARIRSIVRAKPI